MIDLYTTDSKLVRLVREALSELTVSGGAWRKDRDPFSVYAVRRNELPAEADYVVAATALSSGLERFSAGRGAMPVVLPEGGAYLCQKAAQAEEEFLPLTLIGADYNREKAI